MSTGERLMKLRKDRDISVAELAEYFGCTRQYIHSLERSKNPLSRSMLEKYCGFFNTSADFIMGGHSARPHIPVFTLEEEGPVETTSMSIPAFLLNAEKEYFAISPDRARLFVFERDTDLRYKQRGFFKYRNRYYLSRLERYGDGSIWLISDEKKSPERVERIDELASLGYQSWQLS